MPITVTAPVTYYSLPPERDAALTVILGFLNGAQQRIRIMQFQLSHPAVIDALGAAYKRSVDVKIIVDHTEEGGKSELLQLHRLCLLLPPENIRISCSRLHSRFMHRKQTVCDSLQVVGGSLNLSLPGFEEEQELSVVVHADYAAAVESDFDALWAFASQHPAYQNLAA